MTLKLNTTTHGTDNMGLLDYFNQGLDTLKSQPKMYDPHANAQALMGGTPMGQPQGLLNNQVTNPVNNPVNVAQPEVTPQQQQQVTYGPEIGPNMGQVNQYSSEAPQLQVGGHSGQNPVNQNFDNRITPPQVGSMVMGSPEVYVSPDEYTTPVDNTDYSQQGVVSNPPPAVTTPFQFPPSLIGEAFDPSMTEEEKLLREEAKARLPWYLGGTGGK